MTHHKQGTPDGYYPVDGKTWYPIEEPERRTSGDGAAKFIAVAFAFLVLYILWRVLVLWVNDTPWALWIVQHVESATTLVWSFF